MSTRLRELNEINNLSEIPEFVNEDEEDAFWSTHGLGDALLEGMECPPEGLLPPPRSETLPTLADGSGSSVALVIGFAAFMLCIGGYLFYETLRGSRKRRALLA